MPKKGIVDKVIAKDDTDFRVQWVTGEEAVPSSPMS